MEQKIIGVLDAVNGSLAYVFLSILVVSAVWFTLRTKGVQFRLIGEMFRVSLERSDKSQKQATNEALRKHHKITPMKAFLVGLASRVGTGNLAGVATAIAIGGPGSIFWMWMMAIVGSVNSFVECTLAQLYKIHGNDSFVGGPAYYISKGLKKRHFAYLFAGTITLFSFSNNLVQSNTISLAFNHAFGINPWVMAVGLTLLSLVVIFGGIQRIASVSSLVVPLMAALYLGLAVMVIVINWRDIPSVFMLIIDNAFGIRQAAGGAIGSAVIMGIKRGLTSNEAGMGSAPNAAAAAHTTHPVKQGLIETLGVYVDTLVICTCTALIILCSGVWNSGANGIELTQLALTDHIGPVGDIIIAVVIFFFAFSSILGNCFYAESNIFFFSRRPAVILTYRIILGMMVFVGALATLEIAWGLIDFFVAIMTICNVVTLLYLGKYVIRLLNDYQQQRREGKNPEFHKSLLPEITDDIEAWE